MALPPGSEAEVQGQTLVLPEGSGGLTLDQRAMVCTFSLLVEASADVQTLATAVSSMSFLARLNND